MSVREYGVDDYGLVLNTNHLHLLVSKVCKDYSETEWNKSSFDRYEYIEEAAEKLGLEYIGEFSGEADLINDDGTFDWRDAEIFSNDTVYFVPLSSYPNLFSAAYKNMDDVVEEIKKKVGKFLPENFDYRGNIRHITGAYFG